MLRLMRSACAAQLAFVIIAAITAIAVAADAPVIVKSAGGSSRQEILALLTQVQTNFAAADAKGLAACWTEAGEFTGPGGARTEGRENIEKLFQDAFAIHKGGKLSLHVQHLRLVNDGLALVDSIAEMKPAAPTGGTQICSLVLVKQNGGQQEGRWLIESAHETTVHLPPQASPLKELQWLVGDWASPASPGGITLRASCAWTVNQSFLIRKFQVDGKDTFLHGGTEVIGWDPRSHSIRSWVFDSEGGFGENSWVRDGNRWLIKFSGTLADGNAVSFTHIITKVDDDTVSVQATDRAINGTAQPDIPETTLKRQAVKALISKPAPGKFDATPSTPEKNVLEGPHE
jgi:uncharacterized protein (TIGR02246 family)